MEYAKNCLFLRRTKLQFHLGHSYHTTRVLIFLLLTACSPSSRADFYREGESQTKALAKILQKVESIEDLVEESGVIKKRLGKLVDLAIQAEAYEKQHPSDVFEPPASTIASDMLQYELQRICEMEGARDILMRLQKNAVEKLDISLQHEL